MMRWVAGLLEGEGSFTNHPNCKKTHTMQITVQMTDKDVLDRLQSLIGGQIHGPYDRGHKPIYQYTLYGSDAVERVVRDILPYMGARRTEQITKMLDKAGY